MIKRGDIYFANLSPVIGSEQGGNRPVLVLQNDMGNRFSPTVIVAAITSSENKANLPIHVELRREHCGLLKDSIVLLEQLRTIDKTRLSHKVGSVDAKTMQIIDDALRMSLGARCPGIGCDAAQTSDG